MDERIDPILDIRGLRTIFRTRGGEITAVDGIDLSVAAGETVALVGESGSGKSVTSLSVMGLLTRNVGAIAAGSIHFKSKDGAIRDLVTLDDEQMRRIRGDDIGMVFQEPMSSLNPVFTVGDQIAEPIRIHRDADRKSAMNSAVGLLDQVGIPDARRRAGQYPHELSGGMRQRATIAMALACDPTLLSADEPTTALDVTIQAQILDLLINLLRDLQQRLGLTMLFISHDLAVVEYICDRVIVLYLGRIMEIASSADLYARPQHPYTRALLSAIPSPDPDPDPDAPRNRQILKGDIPSPANPPSGCVFRTRCPVALEACADAVPELRQVSPGQFKACIRDDLN